MRQPSVQPDGISFSLGKMIPGTIAALNRASAKQLRPLGCGPASTILGHSVFGYTTQPLREARMAKLAPGLSTFTRICLPFSSLSHVRAKERNVALLAGTRPNQENPSPKHLIRS